jgi:hypothetical protein
MGFESAASSHSKILRERGFIDLLEFWGFGGGGC